LEGGVGRFGGAAVADVVGGVRKRRAATQSGRNTNTGLTIKRKEQINEEPTQA